MSNHYAIAVAAAILTAAGQLLLKRGATMRARVLHLWLNPFTLAGYAVMLLVTLMNLYAFEVVPLRAAVVLAPLSLLLVLGSSAVLFGETMNRGQKLGSALILAGIVLFNL